jgi:hypothetical protein
LLSVFLQTNVQMERALLSVFSTPTL